ncbi:MAG: 2Fe-2S iron-sulfur cluster binding domain-containing protein [Woeseiaceae bacterium]|nr:2Fe-2S iron-sulfur cluster binding domain-containing protein [Woeseiaceae bacterium]
MRQFHSLKVVAKHWEAADAVRLALDVPASLRDEFAFQPGQHLPVQVTVGGDRLRRTYSICSVPGEWPLEIGIRVQPGGRFSEFAANTLAVGDTLEVMPPTGGFHLRGEPAHEKYYLGFAAGSGITPLMSIVATVLQRESQSRFALFYGNREQQTSMFVDDLYALKNRYPERLLLHFVFSREEQEFDIAAGRIDADKVRELVGHFCKDQEISEAFICGPDTMTSEVGDALRSLGLVADAVHVERFGAPRRQPATTAAADSGESPDRTRVTVIMDGHRKSFDMARADQNIVDAAAMKGLELPYSCKGGVCATCRTHLSEGDVQMEINYGLEPWEIEAGFVLACQSRPQSATILLDYDKS